MEGNLYHLIKARKGHTLAGDLLSSIFSQIVSGLDHIPANGYFHRDIKPVNVLVTTGLFDYTSVSPIAPPNAPKENDIVAIIKLADFAFAWETRSTPPYTDYITTRWYRAPEVLFLNRDYSIPIDMWALGTIIAELVNLRPHCEILGDPSDAYGFDVTGSRIGCGPWIKGIELAESVGFQFTRVGSFLIVYRKISSFSFRQSEPKPFESLFDKTVPRSLIQ